MKKKRNIRPEEYAEAKDDEGFIEKYFVPKEKYFHNISCDSKRVKRLLK